MVGPLREALRSPDLAEGAPDHSRQGLGSYTEGSSSDLSERSFQCEPIGKNVDIRIQTSYVVMKVKDCQNHYGLFNLRKTFF